MVEVSKTAQLEARDSELTKMRAAGMSVEQIAGALSMSVRNVRRRFSELRKKAADDHKREALDLRGRVMAALETEIEKGNVSAMKEMLAELNREESAATYAATMDDATRAWLSAAGHRLGRWCAEQTDPGIAEAYRAAASTAATDADRKRLATLAIEKGYQP